MRSQKKRMPAKKPKPQANNMSKNQDDNTIVLDLSDYGAAQPSYGLTSSGIDTITLDNMTTSVTIPSGGWLQSSGTSYTITNGGTGGGYTNWNTISNTASVHIDTDGVNIKEGGDIKIGGKSLSEAIDKIEERLAILKPNPDLEERWEKLKELRKQYMELEKDLLEKEKIMKILKET